MTLDEAIRYLKTYNSGVVFNEEARRLGIEALELYYALRTCTAIDVEDIPSHLPSETKEGQ